MTSSCSPEVSQTPGREVGLAFQHIGFPPYITSLSLEIAAGDRAAILGRNGIGKTTLLRIAARLLAPAQGTVRCASPIGYVPQDYRASLLPWLSVEDNITLPLRGRSRTVLRQRTEDVLSIVPIREHLLRRYPYQLSGGEQQLVVLARALIHKPRLLLLDEPFSALDLATRIALRRVLPTHAERETITVVVVTHELDDAIALARRVIILGGGPVRILRDTTLEPDQRAFLDQQLRLAALGEMS